MKPIRIFLIDDHHVLREGIAAMLSAEPEFAVVGQAGDGATALAEISTARPQIAMLDLKMPGLSGLATLGRLRELVPTVGIIIFTMHDNPAYVWETMQAGARAYLLKSATREELLRAIRAVASGAGFLQAEVTLPLLKRLAHDARTEGDRRALTLREVQVLEFLAEGESNKAIAAKLTITEDTVKTHLKNLYDKLGAADRAHAVAIALRQQLID